MATRQQWTTARINPEGSQPLKGLDKRVKRVKLTDDDRARILALHSKGTPTRDIARMFEGICSRRAIQFVLFPERLAIVKAQQKERRKDGRYYNKEAWRLTQQKHRAHNVYKGLATYPQVFTTNSCTNKWGVVIYTL